MNSSVLSFFSFSLWEKIIHMSDYNVFWTNSSCENTGRKDPPPRLSDGAAPTVSDGVIPTLTRRGLPQPLLVSLGVSASSDSERMERLRGWIKYMQS